MNDRRRPEAQIDAIVKANPDLVVIAGGTEGGASRSVYKLVDLINLTCRVLPQGQRPEVIYAGNQALARRIKENLDKWTTTTVVSNIRPSIDLEDLGPAQQVLNQAVNPPAGAPHSRPGSAGSAFQHPAHALGLGFQPPGALFQPGHGFDQRRAGGRPGQFLNGACRRRRRRPGDQRFSVRHGARRGGCTAANRSGRTAQMAAHADRRRHVVRDYLWQKTLLPDTLPQDLETLAIDQAFARMILQLANQQFLARYPEYDRALEPILASGGVLSQAPTPGQALLMLLDGLQPVGVTTFVLDQNNLGAALGSIASFNTVLPVQVLESGALLNLGTVICPISSARYGTPVVRVKVEYERGNETSLEVTQGSIAALPVQAGQKVGIYLQGINHTLIDPRNQKTSLNFKVVGGACGIVIDARSRPIKLPPDDARRRDMLKKWAMALGN